MASENFTASEVIKAIEGTGGIKTAIARRLGCHRHTVTNYIERYTTVKEAWLDERLSLRDKAEAELTKQLSAGEWKAIRFTIEYMTDEGDFKPPKQRNEITGEDGGAVKVEFINDWRND